MEARRTIDTAPRDGRKIRIVWTDADGQENESVGQYRALDRLRSTGGDWDEGDAGWWVFVDGTTQKKVSPHSWVSGDEEE